MREAKTVISDIEQKLDEILPAWQANHPEGASPIPDSTRECLYRDIYKMGYVIFTADKVGQAMEVRMLSHLLGELSPKNFGTNTESLADEISKNIFGAIENETRVAPQMPQAITVAREFDKRNNTKIAIDIEKLFNELLDCFILKDGNVTSEEMKIVSDYENLWKR